MSRFIDIPGVWWLAIVLVLAVSLPGFALAQGAESNYLHLKALEPLLGTWRRTEEPPFGPNTFTAAWLIERNYMEIRSSIDKDGQSRRTALAVIYWNAKTERMESHNFSPGGLAFDSVWTADGNTVAEHPDTAAIVAKHLTRKVEGDSLTLTMVVEGLPPMELPFKRLQK